MGRGRRALAVAAAIGAGAATALAPPIADAATAAVSSLGAVAARPRETRAKAAATAVTTAKLPEVAATAVTTAKLPEVAATGAVVRRWRQDTCVADPAAVAARPATAESVAAQLPPDLRSKLDAAVQQSLKLTAAPGAVAGVRTPQGTWTAAFGFADTAAGQPMTTDMHMRIGSVTKTFTGTVILQLAQEGKLALRDPIEKYYKAIPNGDRITLEHLATMTSGVASFYTNAFLSRFRADPTGAVFTPDELIAYGVSVSPLFEPGAMYHYSSTNTLLLGKVIEAVTGQSVETTFQQRIFGPLGLAGTSLPDAGGDFPAPHPRGYTLQGSTTPGQPVDATGWGLSLGWASGGIVSTLGDLLTYTRALGTGQGLLSAESQKQRLTALPPPKGYGIGLVCLNGWVGHTGELAGFNTTAYYDTTTDTSVVVMTNSDISSGRCAESPTLTVNPTDVPCASPARRISMAVTEALGRKHDPPTAR